MWNANPADKEDILLRDLIQATSYLIPRQHHNEMMMQISSFLEDAGKEIMDQWIPPIANIVNNKLSDYPANKRI